MIRLLLPPVLQSLAQTTREVQLEVAGDLTLSAVLDELEARYPVLRGTIRDQLTKNRRPFIRFFACGEDLSHQPPDAPLPGELAAGLEPLRVVGAIAGG
jgi:sulfur-carrier protein